MSLPEVGPFYNKKLTKAHSQINVATASVDVKTNEISAKIVNTDQMKYQRRNYESKIRRKMCDTQEYAVHYVQTIGSRLTCWKY